MRIHADRRSIDWEPRPEDVALVDRFSPHHRRLVARLAVAFSRIDERASFLAEQCVSIAEFGHRRGFSEHESRDLAALGHALRTSEAVREAYLAGRVTMPAAAVAGRALRDPELLREDDDWLLWAMEEPLRELRKRLRLRVEEKAQRRERLQELCLHVPVRVVDDFERAKVVASRREGKALTPGQTLDRCVTTYLDCHDPLRKDARVRRVGPTAARPHDRYVPAAVRRELAKRSGDRCEVPGCTHRIFLQQAHLRPHRHGSGREARDLAYLCWRHHLLLDAGRMAIHLRPDGGRDYHFRSGRVVRGPTPRGTLSGTGLSCGDASEGGDAAAGGVAVRLPDAVPRGEMPRGEMPRGEMPRGEMPRGEMFPGSVRPAADTVAKPPATRVAPRSKKRTSPRPVTPQATKGCPAPRPETRADAPRRAPEDSPPGTDRVGESVPVWAGLHVSSGDVLMRDAAPAFHASRAHRRPRLDAPAAVAGSRTRRPRRLTTARGPPARAPR